MSKRARIIGLLVEGNSLRAAARLADVTLNTVTRLLISAGIECARYQDKTLRNIKSRRVQTDEIWGFCYAKAKNVATAKAAPENAGDVWTWVGIDADTKLAISWWVGDRSGDTAKAFMSDLASRLANRVQLTTDGHRAYLDAVEQAFGADIDYAMLEKIYGTTPEAETRYSPPVCLGAKRREITGKPDPDHVSTSYVERQNLTMRMSIRRLTRLTNAFSKKVENHTHAMALHFMNYNFCRIHKTLRVTPAMAAGVTDRLWTVDDIVALVAENEPPPAKRGPYKKRATP
jgi:IS1 family transposase